MSTDNQKTLLRQKYAMYGQSDTFIRNYVRGSALLCNAVPSYIKQGTEPIWPAVNRVVGNLLDSTKVY